MFDVRFVGRFVSRDRAKRTQNTHAAREKKTKEEKKKERRGKERRGRNEIDPLVKFLIHDPRVWVVSMWEKRPSANENKSASANRIARRRREKAKKR